ncbi:SPOR domain-containing protein [Rubrivivax rivuli]|uniref:SPOR domain-containing protein n=1 Tax=Rubrivivax rivuli TaxID=1862385 RepID=A0A437RL97_9BURK|nr:SPOR domain-containing protein [Rubrivivax rivuli]RVU47571.1 hypothetical protein EOE66_07505 [Rubrivivax rivuli]
MDHLRLSAVVARVVAWHNRHPLARRIGAAQVHAVGYVSLPFTGPAPQHTAPSAAQAAAEAIAAAAATPLPVLTEAAEPAHALAEGQQAEAGPAAPPDALGHERSRLRERVLARARELAALPPETQAQLLAEEQAAAVLATLAPALLKPDFSEDFIDPLTPRQVARFALKHGSVLARMPVDGPVRLVQADSLLPGRKPEPGRVLARVLLLTAVVETDTRKSRVLLGSGLQPEVLGRRIHSTPRRAAVLALGAGLVGLPLWIWRPAGLVLPAGAGAALPASAVATSAAAASAAVPVPAAGASAAASAAALPLVPPDAAHGPAAAASAASPDPVPTATAVVEGAPAPAHAGPPSAHAVPIAPAPQAAASGAAAAGSPAAGRTPRVSIVPPLSEEEKARAREARAALRPAAPAASAPAPVSVPVAGAAAAAAPPEPGAAPPAGTLPRVWRAGPTPRRLPGEAADGAPAAAAGTPSAQAAATAAPARAAAPAGGPVFAITTRPLRTRSEADQVRVAMVSLLRTLGHEKLQVEVLPQGDDWRVVALPFSRRAEADQGRTLLVSRGMRVEVVDF